MKTLERYSVIAENYVNGNLEDFRKQLKVLSKKELIVFLQILEDYLPEQDDVLWRSKAHRANNIVHKYLS